MNKKERVDATLRGDALDRVPVSMWRRDFEREWNAQAFAEATVEDYTRYDWDVVKVNPRDSYSAEGWGVKVRPSGKKLEPPVYEHSPIRNSSDWKRLRPLEPDEGVLAEQLYALQLIRHSVGFEAYFVQTIPCPLAIACQLVGGQTERVLQTVREDRSALRNALRVITETFTTFALACFERGANGIFYDTHGWASTGLLTPDQYKEFGEQYDLEFLDAIKKRGKLNILHNGGTHVYFDQLAGYPVQVLSWDATAEGNPNLGEGKRRSGKAVMGGLSDQTLKNGSAAQVQDEVARALEITGKRSVLLAPGRTLAPNTASKNIEAVRRALT